MGVFWEQKQNLKSAAKSNQFLMRTFKWDTMCPLKSFVISGVTMPNSIKTKDGTISPKEG